MMQPGLVPCVEPLLGSY